MTYKILAAIAATDSKNDKVALIAEQAVKGNKDFFTSMRLAYDNMITFGVSNKSVEAKPAKRPSEPDPKGLTSAAFFELCRKLQMRELTGDAAQVAIGYARNLATQEEWDNWYRLILIKDLKAGFSESTINKAVEKKFPQYVIPVFETQLAKDCVDDEGNVDESEIKGKKLIDVKLDGMRCISIVYPNGTVTQYSRNGKELVNFTQVKEQLSRAAKFFAEPTVLDGEIMSANFQDLMKQARRKTDVQANDAVLNLFDILTLAEFQAGIGKYAQKDRSFSLAAWFNAAESVLPNVTVLGQEMVDLDTPAGVARLGEINKMALVGKYEGIMIKDPEAMYECKRSKNWLKMKPFIEETLKVVGVEEGKPDSKFVGMLGALVCEAVIDDKNVKVNVGGGYSIKQRAQLWASYTGKPVNWQKKEKGKWVTYTVQPEVSPMGLFAEVRADALTKSESNDTWSMRFPRFKTFRGTKVGEKL